MLNRNNLLRARCCAQFTALTAVKNDAHFCHRSYHSFPIRLRMQADTVRQLIYYSTFSCKFQVFLRLHAKRNAKIHGSSKPFRSGAGLQCYIVRKTDGKCCEWCSAIAGCCEYHSEPKDVYRRHDNCGCSVTYENGRKRQDVWSKREWEASEPGAGAGERVVLTEEQAR